MLRRLSPASGARPGLHRFRKGALFVSALALALAPGTAAARSEVLVSIDYETDAALSGCPSAAEFRGAVARPLGHDPFRESAPRRLLVRIYARAAGTSGGNIEGRVEWRDANDAWEGERTFSSRSEGCAQIARAMELATTVQLQLLPPRNEETPAAPAAGTTAGTAPTGRGANATPRSAGTSASARTSASAGASANAATPARANAKPPVEDVEPPVAPVAPATPPPPEPPQAPREELSLSAPAAPSAREPRVGVWLGAGPVFELGRGPMTLAPHLAVALAAPLALHVRLGFSGFGPGAKVSGAEGDAQIDRYLLLLELVRFFRAGRSLQPSVSAGFGAQELRVQGTSAAPSVVQAHAGNDFTAVGALGAGLAYTLAPRLALFVEAKAFWSWPSVTVRIGRDDTARLDGALALQGGLFARF